MSNQTESLGSIISEIDSSRTTRKSPGAESLVARYKVPLGVLAGLAILVAGFFLLKTMGGNVADPAAASGLRVVMDAETGQIIKSFRVRDGMGQPYRNPNTGKDTLYEPEACYWTKDGKAKREPTYVILNERLGKSDPTMCPDCGRPVRPHNPTPPVDVMAQAYEAADGTAAAPAPTSRQNPDDGRR